LGGLFVFNIIQQDKYPILVVVVEGVEMLKTGSGAEKAAYMGVMGRLSPIYGGWF
jgi:hypothetical protein